MKRNSQSPDTLSSAENPRMSRDTQPDQCPHCQGPMEWRRAHPSPTWLNLIFGLSFVMFIFFAERMPGGRATFWGWTLFQVILGVFLYRARKKALRRVWRCIRCGADLP